MVSPRFVRAEPRWVEALGIVLMLRKRVPHVGFSHVRTQTTSSAAPLVYAMGLDYLIYNDPGHVCGLDALVSNVAPRHGDPCTREHLNK